MSSFDHKPHIMKLKGKEYLPVAARIAWLRSEHPGAQIDTELVTLDLDAQLAVFKATVTIPETGARATGYGSETAKDFGDYLEKAETKALGRAIAALGYGTLMALEMDEGEGSSIADSPVTAPAARNGSAGTASVATASVKQVAAAAANGNAANAARQAPSSNAGDDDGKAARWAMGDSSTSTKTSPSTTTRAAQDTDWTGTVAQLRARIERESGLELRTGQDWANLARLYDRPEPLRAADMTQDWLLALHQEMTGRAYAAEIEAATSEQEVTGAVQRALGDRDKRHVSAAQYDALRAAGEARKAELSAPLLSAVPQAVAS